MITVRAIDYQGNPGGGVRFTVELIRGLVARGNIAVALVSHGTALEAYRTVFGRAGLEVATIDLPPRAYWKTKPATRSLGIPGTGRLKRWMGFDSRWYFEVQPAALAGCDLAWLPWMSRHRIPLVPRCPVIASFHDAIVFLWPGLVPEEKLAQEHRTVEQWLASSARLVASSKTTLRTLVERFRVPAERFSLIPLAADHTHVPQQRPSHASWPWLERPFVLCPANTSPHKNHGVLLEAYARWGARVPLVLTGYGTDFQPGDARGRALREFAERLGLSIGTNLIPLGYVEDDTYFYLLSRAWALVMPTLIEGGGSFPVMEAMGLGVPVVCSDIAVLREQMERSGGEVLWFDPRDHAALSRQLEALSTHYEHWRLKALAQASLVLRRGWQDVADDYRALFVASLEGE